MVKAVSTLNTLNHNGEESRELKKYNISKFPVQAAAKVLPPLYLLVKSFLVISRNVVEEQLLFIFL